VDCCVVSPHLPLPPQQNWPRSTKQVPSESSIRLKRNFSTTCNSSGRHCMGLGGAAIRVARPISVGTQKVFQAREHKWLLSKLPLVSTPGVGGTKDWNSPVAEL
jgi:hypothetical protein